MAGQNSSTSTQ
ncbi:hypothetical protein LINPERHAP1_LOCUS26602 [Linum perenne]